MNYTQRHNELSTLFQLGKNTHLDASDIDIRFFSFQSSPQLSKTNILPVDSKITENLSFDYPVFIPGGRPKTDKAILLLHGLNERNWNKYLTWAEYLCQKTGKAIILFPIAFHVNRSPQSWTNPRTVKSIMDLRRQRNGEDRYLSFANVTFSERISENPYRFYSSGRQSLSDLTHLFIDIKQGFHPLFAENTNINIFAYSIGAFLAEITLMTNPKDLFSDSRLFMFCGGGVFSSMFGESRCIMDKAAYKNLYKYYMFDFKDDLINDSLRDKTFNSFNSMISIDRNQRERTSFFEQMGNRLNGVSLARDIVMPYNGVEDALGTDCAANRISKMDFSHNYSHENPFPVGKSTDSDEVDKSFTSIFSQAADFLV